MTSRRRMIGGEKLFLTHVSMWKKTEKCNNRTHEYLFVALNKKSSRQNSHFQSNAAIPGTTKMLKVLRKVF